VTAVRLHVVAEGREDAPAVVLAGSLGSTLAMWDEQVPALSERFRVLRFDTRGHGRSPVPDGPYSLDDLVDDAVEVLDRWGIASACFVGLSLGGMTAMRLAARYPKRVQRLVLLCTTARFTTSAAYLERAAAVRAEGGAAGIAAGVDRWFTATVAAPVRVWAEQMVASTPAEGYAACCEAIAGMDLMADLAHISAPTLVVAGADDPATPPEHLRTVADGIRGARLLVLPRAAHLANVEQSVAVTSLLLAHLDPAGETAHERGAAVRRAVLGSDHVDRAMAATTPLSAPFQDFITRYAWGEVWSRPGLDRRSRSMLTLALLTALGHTNELALHVRAALANGLSPAEVAEVLLHTAVYAGVPATNSALAIAQQVLDSSVDTDGPA